MVLSIVKPVLFTSYANLVHSSIRSPRSTASALDLHVGKIQHIL